MKNILKMLTFVSLFVQYTQLYPVNIINGCVVSGDIVQVGNSNIVMVNGKVVSSSGIVIEASGNQETKQLDITDIRNLMVADIGRLTLHQCLECPEILTIIADQSVMPMLQQKKQGKNLTLQMKDNTVLRSGEVKDLVRYYATVKDIQKLSLSGAMTAETIGEITTDSLKIDLSGGSSINASVKAKRLSAHLSSGAIAKLDGNVAEQTIDLSGGAKYNALNLISNTTDIDANGGAKAQVYSTELTTYRASGGSNLECAGPGQVKGKKSGGAKVRKI